MRTQTSRAPEAITFEHDYPGTIDQARHVRADLAGVATACPVADDLVLLASELATNAILHSRSGHATRTFAVRAKLYPGDYAWVESSTKAAHGRRMSTMTSTRADLPSLPTSQETATGESTAMTQTARHGSGSTGT